MIILGIDPGLAETGWGAIEKCEAKSTKSKVGWRVLGYGHIKTAAGEQLENRLSRIHQELLSLIERLTPDVVAIEELFFGANAKTATKVGEARGVVVLTCGEKHVGVVGYTPLEIKVALTGYGRAEKGQVQRMVQRLFSLDEIPKPDHAADALACAYCHAMSKR